MTDLEERLRHDLKTISGCVGPESLRPLRVPPPRRWRATARWLAPVAAVAAVIALVTSVSLVSRLAGTPPAAGTAAAGMPLYYVTLTGAAHAKGPTLTATVRDSVTGTALTSVDVPLMALATHSPASSGSHSSIPAVMALPGPSSIDAAADGRTYAIEDNKGVFLLRVGGDGRSTHLEGPIHVAGIIPDGVAVSPDGSKLAIDVELCPQHACVEGLEVMTLATGATRIWPGPSMAGSPLGPAWIGSQQVMFLWQGGGSRTQQGYRMLSVLSSPGSLLSASRPMTSPPVQRGWEFPEALLTPDGSALISTDYRNVPGTGGRGTAYLEVVELSARTGRLLRVLHAATLPYDRRRPALLVDADCSVLALGPAGLHALVQCPGLGRLDDSRFTPLPGVPVAMNPMTGIGGTAAW
jgi:hypothetical protein